MSNFLQHPRPRSTLAQLHPIAELPEGNGPLERFDHLYTLALGFSNATLIVYEQMTMIRHVLQFCGRQNWTKHRCAIVEAARTSTSLVNTHFVIYEEDRVYVGSQLADMCLADMIHCSEMTEVHVSAILRQVNPFPMVKRC
jgi:hypothetical protein